MQTIPVKKMVARAVVAVLLGVAPSMANAQLVLNGGLESGLHNWSRSFSAGGNCGNVFVTNAPAWGIMPVHTGNWGLIAGPPGGVCTFSQLIPTTFGQDYVLTFWLANQQGYWPELGGWLGMTPNFFDVLWGGSSLFPLTDAAFFPWTQEQFTVQGGTGTSTTLEFQFRHDPGAWTLDDVSLSAVPEPATLVLLGTGLLGIGAAARSRRKERDAEG